MNKNFSTKIIATTMGAFVFVGSIANTTTVFAQEAQNASDLSIITETQSEGVSRAQLLELLDRLIVLERDKHHKVATMVFWNHMGPLVQQGYLIDPENWDYDRATQLYNELTVQEERFHAAIDFDNVVHDIMTIDNTNEDLDHSVVELLQNMALNDQEWFLFFDHHFTTDRITVSAKYLRENYKFLMGLS